MSCSNCAKSYSLFVREYACPGCGFGFCSNCLQKRSQLPNGQGQLKETKICSACFKTFHQQKKSPDVASLLLQRGLDTLASPPPSNPITVYKENQRMKNLKKGLSVEDQQIADRLERLHKERKMSEKMPSDQEMAERLAKLKDIPAPAHVEESGQGQGFYHKPEARAPQKQADDLMAQMNEEITIDKDYDPTKSISERLAKLRGVSSVDEIRSGNVDYDENNEMPSDEEAENLVDQIMAEQKLEEKKRSNDSLEKEDPMEDPPPISKQMQGLVRQLTRELKEDEELPWCIICNEDAKVRCRECDDDLYCNRCFKECHSEFEMEHAAVKYVKKS